MGMPGMGVMIAELSGNAESVRTFTESLNKKISSLAMKNDELLMGFEDGSSIRFRDEGQSCCESRYMMTDDDLSHYVGAELIGAELESGPDIKAEYEEHETQFLKVNTSKGVFTMVTHNEHNGYYGGFAIGVSKA